MEYLYCSGKKQLDFVFVDKPLMIYHIHGGDSISKNRIKEAEEWQYAIYC